MTIKIKKVAVLGAGVMGAQIAAHIANAGIPVALLDRIVDLSNPNLLVDEALKHLKKPRTGALMASDGASLISVGNFENMGELIQDADLIIEAVAEVIDIKHDIWDKVDKVAKDSAIFATNTSGIPIKMVSEKLPTERKQQFIGMHFFNPPRYMKLLELIPIQETSAEILSALRDFSELSLGKGVVVAKDTINFIGNRMGTYGMVDVLNRTKASNMSFSHVDSLTGQLIGRPKTATYRTNDLVGLDITHHVASNMHVHEKDKEMFVIPDILAQMVKKELLGNKVKKGHYTREGKQFLEYDYVNDTYIEIVKEEIPLLTATKKMTLAARLNYIFDQTEDADAQFVWETLRNGMWYAARSFPEITDDYLNIDRALVWGFNWEVGIFKVWDMIGKDRVSQRMKAEGLELPEWVESHEGNFYQQDSQLPRFKTEEKLIQTILNTQTASQLADFGHGVLGFKIASPNNTISTDLTEELSQAIDFLESSDYKGMVIYANGKNFSVGANLYEMLEGINQQAWDTISNQVNYLQQTLKKLKYVSKPVTTAIHGRVLGGGAELMLHSPFVVAHAESYIGLVEAGVGLIPGGGGNKELVARAQERLRFEKGARLDVAQQNVFEKISTAFVSTSASQAAEAGFLRETDIIEMNEDRLLETAINKTIFESQLNYTAKREYPIIALGETPYAVLGYQLEMMTLGHFISDYDQQLNKVLGDLIMGGSKAKGTRLSEDEFLALERDAFVGLCQNEKTKERMMHMLKTGKPLRN